MPLSPSREQRKYLIITRARIGHSHLTHSYIVGKDQYSDICNEILIIEHTPSDQLLRIRRIMSVKSLTTLLNYTYTQPPTKRRTVLEQCGPHFFTQYKSIQNINGKFNLLEILCFKFHRQVVAIELLYLYTLSYVFAVGRTEIT